MIRPLVQRLRPRSLLPEGAIPVAIGLVVNGAATYAFLGIANRTLDPSAYGALSVFWALLFAVGNGIMQPLEQEVARAVSRRRAEGIGPGPVIRRAIFIGAAFSTMVTVVVVALHGLLDRSFGGDPLLLGAFVLGMFGFCAGHLTRGTLSSHRRFGGYARFFEVDGISRVVMAALLGAAGVATAGPFGLVLGLTPFLGVAAGLLGQKGLDEPGPVAPWSELTRNLGWLLLGTSSIALIVQGGTIAVDMLATPGQAAQGATGAFLNGLQTARIPLFLFQAILASLLPKLSRQAGLGHYDDFVTGLRRLVGAILAGGVVATLAAAAIGPFAIRVMFGSKSILTGRDLALLSAAFIVIMATICLDQALIALHAHSRMALGWALALAVFVGVTALGSDLFIRVEVGLLAGSVWAFSWMVACLAGRLRHHARVDPFGLGESLAGLPLDS